MSYQILPNILFIVCVLGIVLIILRHLPNAVEKAENEEDPVEILEKLSQKGLPTIAISRISYYGKLWKKKLWNFLLEAKDLKPTAVAGYKIKKIFGKQASSSQPSVAQVNLPTEIVKDEDYYLEAIKQDPHNFGLYNELGKFYLEKGQYEDAKDIYQYLTQHEPRSSEFFSHLGKSFYKLKEYEHSVENYNISLGLDSTQPNRYYNKALALEGLKQYQEAIDAVSKAISLEHSHIKYYLLLANLELKLGNRNEAKIALRSAKKLDPENEEVSERLKNL